MAAIPTLFPPRLRIGFLSPHNPFDRRAFSGTVFFSARALARAPMVDLKILGGHRPPGLSSRLLHRASPKLDKTASIETDGLDMVVGLVASRLIDPDRFKVPYLHVTDATPGFLRDCYGWDIPTDIEDHEARVIAGSAATIYSSREIADLASADFNMKPHATPFGINIESLPDTCPRKPPLGRLELLFVSTDWARKGGDMAVAVLDGLRSQGIDAHLTVVGRLPVAHASHNAITAVGYLNKNRPRHAKKFHKLYENAHLLLLPTRADCTPMVIAEAMAHGTPVLASDVGGIGTIFGAQAKRSALPLTASVQDWVEAVREITDDPAVYAILSDAAFDRARTRLTWDAWARDILRLCTATRRSNSARTPYHDGAAA